MGKPREEILNAIQHGHYAVKQICCPNPLIAFSHRRRFRTGVELARAFHGKRLLDYGCGDGTFLALLFDAGITPAVAIGADLDAVHVDDCSRRFRNLPARFVRIADLETSDHESAYDVVVCTEVLEHVVDLDAVIGSLSRFLRDDGRLVVSVPIETGVPLIVKQAVRRVAGWRGLGHYRWTSAYTWRELSAGVFAGRRPHIERPVYGASTDMPYHDHKGFNWRALRDRLSQRFDIDAVLASPFAWLGPSLATQVWFVARKKPV